MKGTLSSLGPLAEAQLLGLLRQAAEAGITKEDIQRLEDLLKEIAEREGPDRLEKAASLVDLIQGSKELTIFLLVTVLPFLQNVVR